MIPFLWFLLLTFHHANSNDCNSGTDPETKLCIAYLNDKSQLASTCEQKGYKLYTERPNDDLFRKFEKQLQKMEEVNARTSESYFIGMTKDDTGSKWTYANDEGSTEQDDYPFWKRKPGGLNPGKCATISLKDNFKVSSESCNTEERALCEIKDKHCYYALLMYAEYFGRCISISYQKGGYSVQPNYCFDGVVMAVKDEDDMKAAAAALQSVLGPIYAGLQKIDGQWTYESGGEETERFAPGNPGKTDCGFYGLDQENKLRIFTADCSSKFQGICSDIPLSLADPETEN